MQPAGHVHPMKPTTCFSWLLTGGLLLALAQTIPAAAPRIVTGVDTNSPSPLLNEFVPGNPTATGAFFAYAQGFSGGVRVATGDVNNDGSPDIITGAGPGGGPHVKVFSGSTLEEVRAFFAYTPTFAGGVFVASGDVNNDGFDDIITGADAGGPPHVKVFDGISGEEVVSFFAYNTEFIGGVRVATGDVNGDGVPDIITAPGAGAGPHVKVFDGKDQSELTSFFAYTPQFTGGVFVAAGDVNGDGRADIITGAATGLAHVKVFDGSTQDELASFFAYDASFSGGVRVAAGDVNGDGIAELVTAPGPGTVSTVKVFNAITKEEQDGFQAFGSNFTGGVFVAAASLTRPKVDIRFLPELEAVFVRWPSGEVATLESNENLNNSRGWSEVELRPEVAGNRSILEIPVGAGPRFLRLKTDATVAR